MPAQFSWLDQRLVRENFLRHGVPTAWALYLVLVNVADVQGLSYYSDATLSRLLQMDLLQLAQACGQLIAGGCWTINGGWRRLRASAAKNFNPGCKNMDWIDSRVACAVDFRFYLRLK